MANNKPVLCLLLFFLSGCGGNSSSSGPSSTAPSDDADTPDLFGPGTLSHLERSLTGLVADGSVVDGIWLLAQERTTRTPSSSQPEHLFRSDIITLRRSGNLIIARYCANGAKPLFEGGIIDNQFFDIQGDGYYLPSRETYRGHFTGDGTLIEFSPGQFQNPEKGNGTITLRAYKLAALQTEMSLGEWNTPAGTLSIDCVTLIDTYKHATDMAVETRQRYVSFSANGSTLSIQQTTTGDESSFLLTEVIETKGSWTARQLADETLQMENPLRYQGIYQPPGTTTRTFSINLAGYRKNGSSSE